MNNKKQLKAFQENIYKDICKQINAINVIDLLNYDSNIDFKLFQLTKYISEGI